ncbi:MAG: hypothetical protein HY006_04040 [Candidatus Sungbacteria bacterium]|nr:hypothetical protein [Candidatus Sungbacteria bacterium]
MTRGNIKTRIKNEVDDQTITDALLEGWIQTADERVQTWRPPKDRDQTFDWWDYLKEEKPYTTQAGINKYPLPDNFRAFIELKIQDDAKPYSLIDYRDRENFRDHAVWILGQFFFIKETPSASGKTITLAFVRFSDPFISDNDEPEIEPIYHEAYVAFGKSRYYNQQGDSELESQNMAEFERVMQAKWRDQTLKRMTEARETVAIQKQYLI